MTAIVADAGGVRDGEPRLTARLGRRRTFARAVRHVGRLFTSFWLSRHWKFAWAGLIGLIAIDMTAVYTFVWYNDWQKSLFDSIQARAAGQFTTLVASFVGLLSFQVGLTLARQALGMALHLKWRLHLTSRYLDRWLADDRHVEIERRQLIDNPDQRIAEDIQRLTGTSNTRDPSLLDLLLGLFSTTVSAVSFSLVLLKTAEPIRFALFGHHVALPGDLVWYGIGYVTLSSLFMVWIGRWFIRASFGQQRREGDFRTALQHVRRNAGQIGLADGNGVERQRLARLLDAIRVNYRRLILGFLGIQLGQHVHDRMGSILPLFVAVPRYFSGRISFGDIMATQNAFGQLTSSLSYFVQAYGQIGSQIANLERLRTLDEALDARWSGDICYTLAPLGGTALKVEDLNIDRLDGTPLVRIGGWRVARGERWAIRGASGVGKSTLVQALAGLWSDGSGTIHVDGELRRMFVPQRLYLPLGTLRDALCFPRSVHRDEDEALIAVLERAGLSGHAAALDQAQPWQETLSPGEQQRLALARILLQRPDLLVLDEPTSALDPASADAFFARLRRELPDATILHVVHDERSDDFHHATLRLGEDGVASIERQEG
ncbi:MAG: ATP-binding cassette domain-containing protein [Sphingomonas phyllosphaerae]|uniref:ABC transporter ATP-binding protein/permease n=1 Tax=Sphingomonas phyllosphaerae TaxID=257003 RepID=UPI002FF7F0CB